MRTGNIEIAGSKLGIHSLEAGGISALGAVAVGTTVYNSSYGVIQWYNGTSFVTNASGSKYRLDLFIAE